MTEQEIQQVRERLTPGPKRRRRSLVETGVMLDRAERQALDAVADEQGKSRSALIREAVRRVWLKDRGPKGRGSRA